MTKTSKPSRSLSRRNFLKGAVAASSAAMAVPTIVPSTVFGANAPSNRITFASIGIGTQGHGHFNWFMRSPEAQMLAACDVELGTTNWGGHHKGRFLGLQSAMQNAEAYFKEIGKTSSVEPYDDFRLVLQRDDIDAVVIATPDHWHMPIALRAVQAGKDVYCEKPMTLTISEGRIVADAVKRYKRIFQTGTQQRSGKSFAKVCELVRNGAFGKITDVEVGIGGNNVDNPIGWKEEPIPDTLNYNMWLGPAPWAPYTHARTHYSFRFMMDYSGGQMTNWGAHYNDIAQWGLGMDNSGPVEIEGTADYMPREGLWSTPDKVHVTHTYANGVKLRIHTGSGATKFIGTDGWVQISRGWLKTNRPDVIKPMEDKKVNGEKIKIVNPDMVENHRQNFIDCVKSRKDCICTAEIGQRSASVCHLGNIAIFTGRKLKWDPVKEKFPNDWGANSYLTRKMRNPWNY